MYLSIGWSRLMKCDRDIWKIYFACQKCLQNLAIKFSGNLVDFSKCDPYLTHNFGYEGKLYARITTFKRRPRVFSPLDANII